MEKIISQIEKIREINNQNKLVIFVGAGVSKNSGVCSWWELIKKIAEKIGYDDICEKCTTKCKNYPESKEHCKFYGSECDCHWKYNFSSDEYLKIPQYYVDMKGETEYYDYLKAEFNKSYVSNDIDNLIIALNPEHIITTNYDHLIEDVDNPNVGNYTIIKNDRDLLEQDGRRYIIKMHGDIDCIQEIVLKEDDYLKYSQNHIIIETYIKSLLIDKTFLFIGYSLNDNNLNLIMSYIDYFVKDKGINKRSPHYLVVNNISKPEREVLYWENKGVELVNLSDMNIDMKKNTKIASIKSEQGQSLYTFLKYLYDDKLPYFSDKRVSLEKSLLKKFEQFEAFNFVSYNDLLKACSFSNSVRVINSALYFMNEEEYILLKSIFEDNTNEANKIKRMFSKVGLRAIHCKGEMFAPYIIEKYGNEKDALFEMALKNQYNDILEVINNGIDKLEKAYYYSLIFFQNNALTKLMEEIKAEIKELDYQNLSAKQKVLIAIFEYNSISLRTLSFNNDNKERWAKLIDFLDSASHQSIAFETIKKITGKNGDVLSTLNNYLSKHEEYYMKKSTMTKWGGTIYGDLFELQSIVYDFYMFYKKNYLMLDWFNNVEKMCEPYIKAMLCTYYPDEYQFSNPQMGRTQVQPYPINLIDIDMIVKHTKYKNFNSWLSHYKVFRIEFDNSVDIVEIFENFCISMRYFWNRYMDEHLKVFSKLLSLAELTSQQKHRILQAFITLVEPSETISFRMLRNSLNAIWIYIQKHYDSNDELNKTLLNLLINEQLIGDLLDGRNAYEQLVEVLSIHADEVTYSVCEKIISYSKDGKQKSHLIFIFRDILLRYDNAYWCRCIQNNIHDNLAFEIYVYIESGIIIFDDKIKKVFEKMLIAHEASKESGIYTDLDYQKNAIEILLILLLTEQISTLEDINFLKQYTDDSDYLDFLFNPNSFDYSKITTADYMWCNFINNNKYRENILRHKSDFWSKADENRIRLGFGSDFENRVVYKYLYE